MPLLLLLVLVLSVGVLVGLLTWRYPRVTTPTPNSTIEAAREVGESVRRHPRLRAFLAARLEPETATGLALSVAMIVAIAGGVVFAVLAYLIRTNAHLLGIDNGVAKWGNRHATVTSTHVLNDLTQLGSIYVVVGLCAILAAVETLRQRTVWVSLFIVSVMCGEEILTLSVKHLADRVRPAFNPAAASLGPSFPSGHSATAAAFYATAALLIGRWRPRGTRAVLTGLAAGVAVGVAATRVLLDVHWLTDVVAGLSLGWAWFAVCAIAFGGRILRFGSAAETAARVAKGTASQASGQADAQKDAGRLPVTRRVLTPLSRGDHSNTSQTVIRQTGAARGRKGRARR
jgi:membrane-associated phospholipid phosphatase